MKNIIIKILLVLGMSGLAMAGNIGISSIEKNQVSDKLAQLYYIDDKSTIERLKADGYQNKWEAADYVYLYKLVINDTDKLGVFIFTEIKNQNNALSKILGVELQAGSVLVLDGNLPGTGMDLVVYPKSTNEEDDKYSNAPEYDNSEIFIDTQTGLMWQDDIYATIVTRQLVLNETYNAGRYFDTSGMTGATYCSALTLGGYNDWRLPSIDEFKTIVDKSQDYNIKKEFKNKNGNSYWSSTKYKTSNLFVWAIFFGDGKTASRRKTDVKSIRCVREGE